MVVFPLKWFPYILVIGGIGLVAEGDMAGLAAIAVGAAWLYVKYSNKKIEKDAVSEVMHSAGAPAACGIAADGAAVAAGPVRAASVTMPRMAKSVQFTPETAQPVQAVSEAKPVETAPVRCAEKFCRHCGAKVEAEDKFCFKCGGML